ncbi:CPBP family intramembrane glutamic endopeptidase [Tautonia rosea]|uniref:CPBP family intramembrane glutamic endopeptidase n=1 Tax=Tautonia rosea TaxID=2728037 RepID=UPI001473EE21|nr:CPBP family intramembrane glutamic endopeptidase [Tautonia rosea]
MPLDAADLKISMQTAWILVGMAGLVLLAIATAWAIAIERIWSGRPVIPTRSGRPVPWGGPQVFASFFLWQFATLAMAELLRALRGEEDEPNLVTAMSAVALINLAILIVVPGFLALWNQARAIDFGLVWDRVGRDLILGVLTAIFCLPLIYGVQLTAILIWPPTPHPLMEMLFAERSPWVMILGILSAVIFAPAAEELLFRGVLQGWLEKRFGVTRPTRADDEVSELSSNDLQPGLNPRVANLTALVVPAAVFAIVHFGQWPAPLPLFVLAIALGLLYRRTKSIVAPIAAHATFNGLSTIAMIVIVLMVPKVEPEVVPIPGEPGVSAPEEATVDAEAEPLQAGESANSEENPTR